MSTPGKSRVLIVDDSAVMRRHLSEIVNRDPELEVAAVASNGRLALQRIEADPPDVVTLDVEMPEMDGLTTLRALRAKWPRLPVVMCSSLTERGASATLDALSAGADDYVTKPSSTGDGKAPAAFATDLAHKLRALVARARRRSAIVARAESIPRAVTWTSSQPVPTARVARPAVRASRFDIVAIGSSTGGPNALAEVLPHLPADLGVPIVVVQHMPAVFTKLLAERLDKASAIRVEEAAAGRVLEPGHAYIAPGDNHLELLRSGTTVETLLHKGPPENSCRPAVDVLFRSVVSCYGGAVLAVILTGMGQDGLRGCELVAANGGRIVTQDEATSVVWGMPGIVTEAGLADQTLPLSEIAPAITRLVGPRLPARAGAPKEDRL